MRTKFLVYVVVLFLMFVVGCEKSATLEPELIPIIDTKYYYVTDFSIIDAKKNGSTDNVTIDITYYLNITPSVQSSNLFKDIVTGICGVYQQYYFNETVHSELKSDWVGLTNESVPEANLTFFINNSDIEQLKLEAYSLKDKRLFSCTITGVSPKNNLISVYYADQSRYSYSLERELN